MKAEIVNAWIDFTGPAGGYRIMVARACGTVTPLRGRRARTDIGASLMLATFARERGLVLGRDGCTARHPGMPVRP